MFGKNRGKVSEGEVKLGLGVPKEIFSENKWN